MDLLRTWHPNCFLGTRYKGSGGGGTSPFGDGLGFGESPGSYLKAFLRKWNLEGSEGMGRKTGIVCQAQLLKKALDERVSFPQNARALRNVLAAFLLSSEPFPHHFSIASWKV